jgi:hypothetical protein
MTTSTSCDLSLRHTLATLAYRAAKVLRDAPDGFSDVRAAEGSRTAGAILAHMADLFDWALSQATGKEAWHNSTPQSWADDSRRFFAAVKAFDDYLASGATVHRAPEQLFQGAVADALTHVGQIAMLRRLAGAEIRGENYAVAKIGLGGVGANQPPAVYEFG